MPIIQTNQIDIYYEQHGLGNEDVVLLGGLTSDHQVWKSIVRLLSPNFRLLILDNRGAGQTRAPDMPYTIEMMAQDTLALMDALHISRAHVVGHSMGSAIAQQMTLIAPEKINKLVLTSTRAKPNAVANMILSMREKLQALNVGDDILAEYTMPFLFHESFLKDIANTKRFIQWTLQNKHLQTAMGYHNQLHAVAAHNIFDELHRIQAPTLLIAGRDDILMPMQHSAWIAERIPNSRLHIMDGVAHMPHVEKSREFAQVVKAFF